MTVRIAMWSGPRNISTAMMRSFSSRADCFVSDEPFYGAFLKESGADHPMRDEVIASMETDWQKIADNLGGDPPDGSPIWYQKQMAHHMAGPIAPDDLQGLTHAFLIRDPRLMAASYAKKREAVTAADLGLRVQREFFDRECDRLGHAPPVVDSAYVLAEPAGVLSQLCWALGIAWDLTMLSWPGGPHPQDGVWAAHWYGHVEASTGFEPAIYADPPELEPILQRVADACMDDYDHLSRFALRSAK
ncbi:MAG TPA: HAD family hydrolase [Sphingomicrobium sp.]|nr:HAD family hydrolase [Sphingomicrobium sp.]